MLTCQWLALPGLCCNTVSFLIGYYVYVETSWQSQNDTAVLQSATVPLTYGKPSNMICLQFWYHMYGQHVDTLNLFLKRGQQLPPSPIWTKSGTQGNKWRLGQVAVTSRTAFQVGRFIIFINIPSPK